MELYNYLLQHFCPQAEPAASAVYPARQPESSGPSKIRTGGLKKRNLALQKLPEGIWPADNPSDHLAF